ncbi:MAG TPA: hypothetical protein VFS16_09715 [Acidimicrobiia bacterium]|nr:hypothetical protein [Acidimicrobiia bacterium]
MADELAEVADEDLQPSLEVVAQVFRTDTVVEPGSSERVAFDRYHEAVEACGGEDERASGTSTTSAAGASTDPEVVAFCERLLALDEAGQDEQVDTDDLEDLDRLYDRLDEVADAAPAQISEQLRLIADAQRFLATGIGSDESLPESIEGLEPDQLDARLDEAYGQVSRYLADECGISGPATVTP